MIWLKTLYKVGNFYKLSIIYTGLLCALQGCVLGLPILVGGAALTTTSFIHTDSLPTDTLAETVTGYDCNYVRQLKDGGALCRNPNKEFVQRPIHCYRDIGGVTCYDQPDPTRGDNVVADAASNKSLQTELVRK